MRNSREQGKTREDVLKEVSYAGYKLRFAPEELQRDREVVRLAVSQNGESLQFAAMELKA